MDANPLQKLRKDSKLTMKEIVEQAMRIDEKFPRTHAGLFRIETRGTRDYWQILALSSVYKVPADELAQIAKPKPSLKN